MSSFHVITCRSITFYYFIFFITSREGTHNTLYNLISMVIFKITDPAEGKKEDRYFLAHPIRNSMNKLEGYMNITLPHIQLQTGFMLWRVFGCSRDAKKNSKSGIFEISVFFAPPCACPKFPSFTWNTICHATVVCSRRNLYFALTLQQQLRGASKVGEWRCSFAGRNVMTTPCSYPLSG